MAGRIASRGSDQFMLRFPEGMRDRIKEQADEHGRSMNAEIIARLQNSFVPRTNSEDAYKFLLEEVKEERKYLVQLTDELARQLEGIKEITEAFNIKNK